MAHPRTFIVVNCDPNKTAHFFSVASILFEGTYVECEREVDKHFDAYIMRKDVWTMNSWKISEG